MMGGNARKLALRKRDTFSTIEGGGILKKKLKE